MTIQAFNYSGIQVYNRDKRDGRDKGDGRDKRDGRDKGDSSGWRKNVIPAKAGTSCINVVETDNYPSLQIALCIVEKDKIKDNNKIKINNNLKRI